MEQIRNIGRRGWLFSAAITFNRIVPQWLFRCRVFSVYRLDTKARPKRNNPNVAVKWCQTEAEFQAVEQLTYFQREFSTGPTQAAMATVDGNLLGGSWAAKKRFDENELGIRIILSPEQAWLFAALVAKEARGQHVYPLTLKFVSSKLAQEGLSDQLVAVNPVNKASVSVHEHFAKTKVGTVYAARFMNMSCCFSSKSIKTKKSFTSNAKDRPVEYFVPTE